MELISKGFYYALGSGIIALMITVIGFYFNSQNRLKNLEKRDLMHDKEIEDLYEKVSLRASKDFAESIKADINRELSEVKHTLTELHKIILELLKDKK